jgi:putative salt-induced outer membrane protein YdiY
MTTIRVWLIIVTAIATPVTSWAQAPAPAPAPAQAKEPKLGPSNSTELGLVIATGNAKSTSVGLRNLYTFGWTNALLRWEGGWLRATSRDGDRFAVQTPSGFDVVDPESAVDSHRLFSKLGYQRQLTARHDWFANFDAVRDEPSNISRQFVLAGGLGTTWQKTDRLTFRTAYGISYTDEDLVVEGSNRFAGYRLYYGLKSALAATTTLESELTTDGSFDTGDDIRLDWLNGVSVAINSRMALKSSVRMLFRNLPALEVLDLRTPGGVVIGTVEVAKKQVDTNITTSLVISF